MKRSLIGLVAAVALFAPVVTQVPTAGAQAPEPHASDVECKGGEAAGFPCRKVDLLSFVPMSELGGGRASDIWGWKDPETKREYALMGTTGGLAFIEVTNPTDPIYLGKMPKGENALIWQDVEVYKDHAYVVCDLSPCALQIFDLTRLRDAGESPQTWTPDSVYPLTQITHTIDINTETGFAYLNGNLGLNGSPQIVDLKNNPLVPVPVGLISDDGYTHDSHCRIYRGADKRFREKEICFNANEDSITVYDVTDKLVPAQLAKVTYERASYTHQAWLTKDHNYILVSDETDEQTHNFPSTTYIFDVRKLTKPKLIGTYVAKNKSIDHNNYILGDLDYQASYTAGLRILDVSKVAHAKLREVGYFDVVPASDAAEFDGAWAVYPFLPSGSVLMSGMGQGLFVVDPKL